MSSVQTPGLVNRKFSVGILGATGTVGQRFLEILDGHPWFEVTALGASSKSSGRKYGETVQWKLTTKLPARYNAMVVKTCVPENFRECQLVFSGLDSAAAGEIETSFAQCGVPVFSNSVNHRYDEHVPILLPFVNPEHLEVVTQQKTYKECGGFIVTNANCSTTGLAVALKPIFKKFGVSNLNVTTLQAISGAGYRGLPAMDIMDNVIPNIMGEEKKLELEPNKIFGQVTPDGIKNAQMAISASCYRVPITDGHSLSISLNLGEKSNGRLDAIKDAFNEYQLENYVASLPSCPPKAISVSNKDDRPQPKLDRMEGLGMTCTIGRIRHSNVFDVKFNAVVHNTILGAAGGAILNAELAVKQNYIKTPEE